MVFMKLPSLVTLVFEDLVGGQITTVPLTSLKYHEPVEGLPPLPNWKTVAADIYWSGFQSLREPFEVTVHARTTEMTAFGL